jgi:septal ring factor EnvC (AmiA/AmiB activator)
MVHIENIYYYVMVLIAVVTILGLIQRKMINAIKTAISVSRRVEGSLDKIDNMDSQLKEVRNDVSENNEKVSRLESQVGKTRKEVSQLRDAVGAIALFKNGDLDEERLIEDLDVEEQEGDVSKYFDGGD